MAANRYYAVRASYTIQAALVGAGGIHLGRGIDMLDPDRPVMVPAAHPFFATPLMTAAAEERYEVSADSVKDAFALIRTESVEQEAAALNAHFRASYGITAVDAALDMAREERKSGVSAYVLLSHVGDTRSLSTTPYEMRGDLDPLAEHLANDEEAFVQFRRDFGTHYIETVTYGLSIAIRGRLSSTDSAQRAKLAANMTSGFGALRGGAEVDAAVSKALHASDLQISCEVSCGGIDPPRPLVIQGFDQIAGLLGAIASGSIRFRLAPIGLTLFSYWNLLDPQRLPRCRGMLDPVRHGARIAPPAGVYGVPAGTVVAWHPPAEAIDGAGTPAARVVPPAGWALCDGANGTPDLRDRFVRGTVSPAAIAARGGAAAHDHKAQSGDVAKKEGLVLATRTAIVGITGKADHLPPYATLVYIMKLAEADADAASPQLSR